MNTERCHIVPYQRGLGMERTYIDMRTGGIYSGLPCRRDYNHRRQINIIEPERQEQAKENIRNKIQEKKEARTAVPLSESDAGAKFYMKKPATRIGGPALAKRAQSRK